MTWRFFYQPVSQVLTLIFFALGGMWMFAGITVIFGVTVLVDEICGDISHCGGRESHSDLPLLLTGALTVALVLVYVILVGVSVPGSAIPVLIEPDSVGGILQPQPLWALAGGGLCLGMHIAAAAGNVGHEFAHRSRSPALMSAGQWLAALALHTSFPIEHVVGHHRNVATDLDPTTARRGEGFWAFAPRSVSGAYRNAFSHEAARCRRSGRSVFCLQNRAMAGYFKQAAVFGVVLTFGGVAGLIAFMLSALIALVIIEQFNYVAHYGLVRLPGEKVRADHSWNWSRLGSSSFMFNLTRHSAHHLSAATPYWRLPPMLQGPTYRLGPFLTVMIALCPPLFRWFAASELARWDRTFASSSERDLLGADKTGSGARGHPEWQKA